MEDEGGEAHVNIKGKRPCEDLDQYFVENPSSASATVAAGTNAAQVSGGSIFKILAGRQALKCPRVEDLVVNSTSATTGRKAQVKGNQSSASLVEIPSSASAPTGERPSHPALDPAEIEGVTYELVTEESFYEPLTPLVFSDIYYVYRFDGYRMVTEVKYRRPRCIRLQN
ncbi:hypothetical protein HanRHA438_Chr03g0125191 [Helianthus annuus]|uniref:Uncharacterized protein n=1 Tax=Helianthus annuus TaxID=4232 RepID=A0A251V819_HELAN|nr:uncharacterized protein LOC110929580 [Helianthus annuus]KAF5814633.1 hypothetical protein HanXRQr2_Chr03g0113291 [Helianthus annuus]KAJ0593212.1 hypothetical protein HanHA300_Chr03g0094501 [Helianthus annuus]KAJ0601031.1 hypothetical protein HanIR_Chr03g0123781 [Helianthus annuus]KAJ0608226.1 hypothetical protein HanHA89_Chr03g0106221 [Helianthus annuus]KAJ0768290.1 hypothetical protein HanLR1_Chr03g0099581 [Helianthus annuus]